ncbi:MAG: hemolysin family protein [Alphaproteobacteria bacterium]|jgi:CBS domain containing-hemolysin-like protein|uniref:hemolysin family protein n=1 Tax=Pacificispira sp. TaxID=2888761 RepID=UPI001B0B0DA8|nr:HlyC/CorC family transporter [Alphaproteobacteria bacterium]MBO6861134.1 HlyC/CorC family transporter [Alphaproteobacteria bacterium]MEC9267365.1 hemolysin family protein [Pseudomonadota bacterium]
MADQITTSDTGSADPGAGEPSSRKPGGLRGFLRALLGRNGDSQLRDSFEELLEQHDDRETPIDPDERALIDNILNVGEETAYDVMVPRADIVSVPVDTNLDDLVAIMSRQPHSRYPVHRESLDDVLGMVHIKDVLAATTEPRENFSIRKVMRKVLFVAPSMRVLDLLLQMRMNRLHMALVVDEYGGIDGLVTIEDLVEEIVGEIEDEHDVDRGPKIERKPDGTWIADARLDIEDLEDRIGPVLTEEEREEDIDTIGGLVFTLAGRVPIRGELIPHEASGLEFEVLEADPRRIKRIRLRYRPPGAANDPIPPSPAKAAE